MEHLQRRLAVDAGRPRIRIAITELLLRSYYPQQQQSSGSSLANNQNQVLRCLRFVQENLPASIAFYTTFHKFTSVGSASKVRKYELLSVDILGINSHTTSLLSTFLLFQLLIMLLALFTKPATFWREVADNSGDSKVGTELRDRVLQVSVLRVMAVCLDSIAVALRCPEHSPSQDLLLKYFTVPTVTSVADSLSQGIGHDVATALFLQIVATVWKLSVE